MAVSVQIPTVFNPKGKKKNPLGYLAALGSINPQRTKGKTMPKKKATNKPKAASGKKSASKPKARNSSVMPGYLAKSKPRRKNGISDSLKPMQVAKEGATMLAGLLISRQAPQAILGASNEGVVGYLANAGVAAIGGIALGMMFGARTGFSFAAGGAAYTISRVASEKLSPVSKYFALSGVGDVAAASMGDVRRAGIGIVVDSSYNVPQLRTPNGRIITPSATRDAIRAEISANNQALAAAAAKAMIPTSGVGRFNRAA